jgi:hypothetical protein
MTGDITIRSSITPAFTFNVLQPANGQGGFAGPFLQPSIDIDLDPFGSQHIAPYGEPSSYSWLIGLGILLGIVFIMYRVIRK